MNLLIHMSIGPEKTCMFIFKNQIFIGFLSDFHQCIYTKNGCKLVLSKVNKQEESSNSLNLDKTTQCC